MDTLKENICKDFILSELMDFIENKKELLVPVYVVYGQYEDVSVIDKILHKKIYHIKNLYIVDEMNSYCLKFSNSDITIRLFGIGGGYLDNNLFNSGDGEYLHAGSNCHTWLTIFQLGQILINADKYEKELDEIRLLITTANPMKKALIAQLGLALKANFHISPGNQNIRYHVSFNLQCITDKKHFFGRLVEGHLNFEKTYIKVKDQIKDNLSEEQTVQLERALSILNYFPKDNIEFRSCWYWIIPCMKYGSLTMDYLDKKMSINMCSSGVYFFRHQDKHDKKLENAENGMETRSQVAINILDSLNNNKKENVNPNEKNEKLTNDFKRLKSKEQESNKSKPAFNDKNDTPNNTLNNKMSKNDLMNNNKLKKKNSKVFIRNNNINESTMDDSNDLIMENMKVNKALYMNNGMIDGNKLNQNYDEILMKDNSGFAKTSMNELWKNPELIPNYQPQSQQKLMTSNKNDMFINDYRPNDVMDAMNKMSLTNMQKPVNSPNFMYPKFAPLNNKKGNKNNTINHWDNGNVPKKDDNNNKNMKKKDKPDNMSFTNNEYDTSIVINNLSKDVSEKMIQIFYKDFIIKNLKINRNSENIIAYIDFENAEMCTEAKKMNTLPLKDNRKKFVIGRSKPSSDDDLKKRENLLLNINNKNHNNNYNFKNVNHNNDLLMKQQVLRKTKSNNSIYTGWKTTSLSDQDKSLDFNEKMIWQRQSTSNIMLDQNNSLNTINLNNSSNNSSSTSGNSNNNSGNANNSNNKYMRWSINETVSTDMWMNNTNASKLKDNSSFNNVNMNDHGLTNKASFNNIPVNNFEGYPYMPSNNSNLPPKQQHPFYMNPLNNKLNNSNWDTPDGTMDQNINQNSGMMSSIGPGIKNSNNKLMINQGQGPSLYMNQMQQPNPMMAINQSNGMMLNPQNPFPNPVPPNRNKSINSIMNNNYTAPPQAPPQNMNLNNGPLNNNPSLLTTNGTTDMGNALMNDNPSPNEWNNSNGNMNNFMPLYYQDGNMNGPSGRPMKLMYNQYPNPNKTNPSLNPGSSINNVNGTVNNSTTTANHTNNVGNTNGINHSNPNSANESGNIWDPPPFNNQNFYSMNNGSWNVFNNSNNIRPGMPLNTSMNDNSNGKA